MRPLAFLPLMWYHVDDERGLELLRLRGGYMDYRRKKCTVRCEDCEFYRYDEELDLYSCEQNLDEDEVERMSYGGSSECPYFRFFDEYKSTQRQN